MDVDDAAAGEDVLELVALQLVVAGAAADDDGLDVEVVQRVGDAVEQHPVVGDDLLGLVELAAASLRVAAAQVPRRQHRLHAGMPEHCLSREPDLREQTLRAATREVEDRLGVRGRRLRVADDRDVVLVLDVEQRPGRLLRQVARHLLVDEVDHLLLQRRGAHRRRRRGGLLVRQAAQQVVRGALRGEADVDHRRAHQLDRLRPRRVEEHHRHACCRAGSSSAPSCAAGCALFMDTSPKSIFTGHGDRHL